MNLKGKKGVDISSLNGNVSIEKIKDAGYDFVMIRCGYGSDLAVQDDSQFENNVRKCEAAGVPWGAYLYSYAVNTDDAKSEARHVIRLLKNKKPTLPVAFDMEDADGYKARNGNPSNATLVAICKTFLSEIKKAGYYPMLYSALSWLNGKLNDPSLLDNYDIWVAQWNSACDYRGSYGMWQYGGEVNYSTRTNATRITRLSSKRAAGTTGSRQSLCSTQTALRRVTEPTALWRSRRCSSPRRSRASSLRVWTRTTSSATAPRSPSIRCSKRAATLRTASRATAL